MKTIIRSELSKLINESHVDQQILEEMIEWFDNTPYITKNKNGKEHMCAFFVPVDKKNKRIFLGHHIRANSWIPPGGHIEEGESPIQTIKREFFEELKHTLTDEPVRLFDVTYANIRRTPDRPCITHYDIWYIVLIDKKNFRYDKSEFYQAGWFSYDDAINKVTAPQCLSVVNKIGRLF